MNQEFTLAKGWNIFLLITGSLFAAGGLACLYFSGQDQFSRWVLFIVGLTFFFFGVCGILETIKGKFIINDYSLTVISIFKTRELLIKNIQGYRFSNGRLVIVPFSKLDKKIDLSGYKYLADRDEFLHWLENNFEYLDRTEYIVQLEEILDNHDLGYNKAKRESYLDKVTKICKWLNSVGLAIGLWLMVYPVPYKISVSFGISFPLLALGVFYFYRNLVTLNDDSNKSSAAPSLVTALIMPAFGLLLRAIIDFEFIDFHYCLQPCAILLILLAILLFALLKNVPLKTVKPYNVIGVLIMFALAYTYGTCIAVNCVYDQSQPVLYCARVLDHRVSTGKHNTFYLTLSQWGSRKEEAEVSVPEFLYNQVSPGIYVNVYTKKGTLKIPWFFITR